MEKNEFIELTLGSHNIVHGYDKDNKEIIESVHVEGFSKKLVAKSRIKSVSEKFILTDYAEGRWIYWEYQEDFETIKNKLLKE
ncbi:hypothetical protein SAMN04489761_4111 [Tenacibaculum sp. MAR_2009_124]|uniref:hypothetical protein n=1 Tax=Tenacibaculum sp. MAR_2009_124 TaxID=1250059 RepID=UPI00089BEFDE|nr:hypothetical protein [Tenacibaculum sp. MAR_2009_124]SED05200.1 hypothetical protein SAMN04489761_4111 [Tenacibaculum sp. MAR_2009_124]